MLVRQIADSKLAQYAYLVGCPRSGEALIIDPERDVDRYFEEAARHKLRIVAAVDTHIHADYLSGLREMAERGVLVYASREGGPEWQYEWLRHSALPHRLIGDGDQFSVGFLEFKAVHTPGHTPEHLSYLVKDVGSGASDYIAIASGDFVFVGDVGRPDLLERAAGIGGAMVPAAKQQYQSIRQHFQILPEFMQVWPGHGAGSACGKSLGDVPSSTVGYELRTNHSIHAASDEQTFVDFILAGQPEPPMYFARMKRDNRRGPALLPTLPNPVRVSAADVATTVADQATVVLDTRSRAAFFAGHLPGALLTELDYQFCSIAGSFVEEDTSLVLVVDDSHREEAIRALVRVGLDRITASITPDVLAQYAEAGGRLARTQVIDMAQMETRRVAGEGRVLDVRGQAEFENGHAPGAINVAHTRILAFLDTLPTDTPLLVHCNSGARSAAVVSLLERRGFQAIQVNDKFANYRKAAVAAGAHA
jgi:hydroxyacylglutathione hydrolase